MSIIQGLWRRELLFLIHKTGFQKLNTLFSALEEAIKLALVSGCVSRYKKK